MIESDGYIVVVMLNEYKALLADITSVELPITGECGYFKYVELPMRYRTSIGDGNTPQYVEYDDGIRKADGSRVYPQQPKLTKKLSHKELEKLTRAERAEYARSRNRKRVRRQDD